MIRCLGSCYLVNDLPLKKCFCFLHIFRLSSQPLSLVSEHKLNTGHQCVIRDVTILDLEENWHRGKIKEAINIHRGSRH